MERMDVPKDQELYALLVLDYIRDLLTESPKEQFTRDEILVVLTLVRTDPEMFSPELVAMVDDATREFEAAHG